MVIWAAIPQGTICPLHADLWVRDGTKREMEACEIRCVGGGGEEVAIGKVLAC